MSTVWGTSDKKRADLPWGRAERDVKVFTMHTPPSIAVWTFKLRNHLSLEFSPWYFQTTKSKTVDKGDGTTSTVSIVYILQIKLAQRP